MWFTLSVVAPFGNSGEGRDEDLDVANTACRRVQVALSFGGDDWDERRVRLCDWDSGYGSASKRPPRGTVGIVINVGVLSAHYCRVLGGGGGGILLQGVAVAAEKRLL